MQLEVIIRKPQPGNQRRTPILCVHGGYHGAWCWDEHFLPYFAAQGYESYALSLRGHGQSDGYDQLNRWRIADYVTDVETVVSQLSVSPVLVGHSLGGIVVQKYLERHSAPAGILLASTPLHRMVSATAQMLRRYPRPILKTFLTFNMMHARSAFETIFFSSDMSRQQAQGYLTRMGNESFRAFTDVILFQKPNPKLVKTRMLVMGGDRDLPIFRKMNEDLAGMYHTTVELFPMAHDMMLEANWKMAASRIVAWLTERNL